MKDKTFESWLSGFVDGEGYFIVSLTKHEYTKYGVYPRAVFGISLSIRDEKLIKRIHKFLKCGNLSKGRNNTLITLHIEDIKELSEKIVPFFEENKLQSQKANDFEIWKQVVKIKNRKKAIWTKKELIEIFDLYIKLNKQGKIGKSQKQWKNKQEFIKYINGK